MLPFNLPELEVSGLALVTAIDDCPLIADGEGSVVTARFVTREVHVVASVDVLGADGTVETITGTTIHPVWSVDRQEWVPLAELADGETLQGLDGLAVVLSVTLSRVSQPVYNIEVHGEHVYQVGELGLVVHNVKGAVNLFKFNSAQALKARGWKEGDSFLHLPNQGTAKLNWAQNSSRLREAMRSGKPIFDSYIDEAGNLIPTRGFLNAERELFKNRGWTFNTTTGAWHPPVSP